MVSYTHRFLLAFIPLFVAIDVLSVVPFFINLTTALKAPERRRLVGQATMTALTISVVFLVAGRELFKFLGITEDDFRIGGGIVLLVLSITELLFSKTEDTRHPHRGNGLAIVPIGIPLIIGPTALTTILILVDSFGYGLTLLSLIVNLIFVALVFLYSNTLLHYIGQGGAKAFAKVSSLFLTAIAVMMIRIGLTNILASFPHG